MKPRVIVHIDMDAFFAAVEQRDNPRLRGKPVIIGADPKEGRGRGVVSTCSYEARKFGVHSAQPISMAYKRCPHGVYLRGNSRKYREVSHQIRDIFYDFTPDVQPISIDEAFLDITGSFHFYQTPFKTCQELKKRIYEKTQLNSSVGIAPVKFVAKIASDYSKPDGLLEIQPWKVEDFLLPLPIERLWGVGSKTKQSLNGIGINTIGDLAKIPFERMLELFGEHGRHLYELSHGIDLREVEDDDEVKSVSHEHTFDTDEGDKEKVQRILLWLSEKVSRRLRKQELKGKTITVKIRLKGFKTYTRATTISVRTNLIDDIYRTAKDVFERFYRRGQQIRLIGVRVSNFEDLYVQDSLFEEAGSSKKEGIQKALDVIKDKFGESSIHRGA